MPTTNHLLHLVMDYAPGDLALAEVVSEVSNYIPSNYAWHTTSVPSFDTISTGFIVGQLGLGGKNKMIYANCAPRKDSGDARKNNEGEKLVYCVLNNTTRVVAVNSGYSLSFIKHILWSVQSINVSDGGSQFRSRDNFPRIVGELAHGSSESLGEALRIDDVIPDMPESCVGYIDSFGNLKTTIRDGDDIFSSLSPSQIIGVEINGIEKEAKVSSGSFHVRDGEIAFSRGSSGGENRFWEIFQRGGSARETFNNPVAGSVVIIKK